MGLLDGILGGLGSNPDISGIARQVGIDPALVEKAIVALGKAQPEPGDTVETASARTGLDTGVLCRIVEQLGGERVLGQLGQALDDHPQAASLLKLLDRDGDGNPLDDVASMAKGLFGRA